MPTGRPPWRCRYSKIGDVEKAQGHLADAFESYQADLAIADRLAKSDPANGAWQRYLSVAHVNVGDVLRRSRPSARGAASRFATCARHPRTSGEIGSEQRFVASSILLRPNERVGRILEDQARFRRSVDVPSRPTGTSPNAWRNPIRPIRSGSAISPWATPMSATCCKPRAISAEALQSFQSTQAIFERLARSDPGNAGWQRDLWRRRINGSASIQEAQGQLHRGLASPTGQVWTSPSV